MYLSRFSWKSRVFYTTQYKSYDRFVLLAYKNTENGTFAMCSFWVWATIFLITQGTYFWERTFHSFGDASLQHLIVFLFLLAPLTNPWALKNIFDLTAQARYLAILKYRVTILVKQLNHSTSSPFIFNIMYMFSVYLYTSMSNPFEVRLMFYS